MTVIEGVQGKQVQATFLMEMSFEYCYALEENTQKTSI